MPFTTKEIVKKHILDHHLGETVVENEVVRLEATDSSQLQKRMIVSNSEKIKAKEQNEPTQEDLSFSGSDSVSLSHSELIPESVVVATDSSLGTVYVENVDYHVDYDSGSVSRIDSGSIPSGAQAVIWYLYYRSYQRGVDYDIDCQRGTIKRRSSGAIESGQWVLVDYTTEFGSVDDDVIDNAIAEANDQILTFIDEAYRQSSDRSLVIAETYLAVSIICRIRAMESVSPSRGKANNANEARSWAALSDMYKKEAYDILSKFAGAIASFRSPSRA